MARALAWSRGWGNARAGVKYWPSLWTWSW
jgi:hypothetical protein